MSADYFEPSVLGTKEHWVQTYTQEIRDFQENGDVGYVWFGHQSQRRMAGWLEKCETVAKDAKILDIGCGNGALLCELAERGFTNLWGTDYCQEAIDLAEQVTNSEGVRVKLVVGDITTAQISKFGDALFEVCTDKGTYDAISLCPEDSCSKRKKYIASVASLLTDRGIFVITSCNWTGDELEQQFKPYFVHRASIPAPSFQFGGKTGQTVFTLVLQKASS